MRLSVDIFTYVYSIYANRITFDYVCVWRNEIDPKGPCHIYIYSISIYDASVGIYVYITVSFQLYIIITDYICDSGIHVTQARK